MADITKSRMIASTIGFEQPQWNAQYYPEECPKDWRFAYFMNDFRAVYLPADVWYDKPQQIQQIAKELDTSFDLVLEWPVASTKSCKTGLSQLLPLRDNIASLVLNIDNATLKILTGAIKALAKHHPVALNSEDPNDPKLLDLAKHHKASVVWHPALSDKPIAYNGYQVVRLACQDLRKIKTTLITAQQQSAKDNRFGLFFEPAPKSAQCAMQTRQLIELLDIA